MPLEANPLHPRDPIRNPHLPHIMRLGRGQVALDYVLQHAREHLAVGVACETGRPLGGEGENDGAGNVVRGLCRDPAVVSFILVLRRRWRAGGVFEVVVISVGAWVWPFALLGSFVAFEREGLDHL